jgi:hypothetical protein
LKAQRLIKDGAIHFAHTVARISAIWLGIASLTLALAAMPAEAKQRHQQKSVDEPIADIANGEPMTLVISTGAQKVDVYRGTKLVTTSQVSTGMAAHPTFLGVFSILEKQRWHHSNIYSGAPMPWMNRITWSGTALHAGVVPGYPASHGCIRLPYSFAPKLFDITTVGDGVVIARDRPVPTLIEHPNLFQPMPPPPPPTVTQEDKPARQQSGDATSTRPDLGAAAARPVILASAEMVGNANDASPLPGAAPKADKHGTAESAAAPAVPALHAVSSNDGNPNRTHAVVDPSASAADDHAVTAPSAPAKAPAGQPAPRAEAPAAAPAQPVAAGQAASPAAASPRGAPAAPAASGATPSVATPSVAASKIDAGVKAAAIQAAEPRSNAPLRILVTRRTQRDRTVGVQNLLASMGYLPAQNFDGTIGKPTIIAIKAFQKANGMPETGAFTDNLVKKVYEVAGKGEPPVGHMFVRQEFGRVFDAPVTFKNPDQLLGTHLYTALKFSPGDTKAQWITVNLAGNEHEALDRIEIPEDVRQKISERLTPGSSLIIADKSVNTASLPKGGDFMVLTDYSAAAKIAANGGDDATATPSVKPKLRRNVRRYNYNYNRYSAPWWAAR